MKFFDASRYASPLRKALDKKENAPRNLRFETLENRALLSVTPLDELQAAVASAEIAPAQTVETPVVDLSVLAVSNAKLESNADDQYEGENGNNTVETATQLGTLIEETTLEAFAGTGRELDYYRVKFDYVGTDDDYLRLETHASAVGNFTFTLEPTGTQTISGYSAVVVDGAKVIKLAGLPKGEYLIKVSVNTSSTLSSPYTLTIEPPKPEADDRYENVADGVVNNDSFTNAYDLDMVGDLTLDAKAGPNHNPDYFKFTMVGTGTAQNQIKLSAADNAYLNFRLYSANDTQTPKSEEMTSDGSAVLSLEDLAAGDYYVFVDNNLTADSFVKYSLTFNAPKVAPAAPTNFKATENVSETTSKITKNETTLAWDAVENATYYEIRYTTDVDAANPTWSEIEKVEGLSQEVSLAYATSYKYQVRAVTVFNDTVVTADTALEGAWTDLQFSTVAPPTAPTDLAASKLNPETHKITLTWGDVDDELEYQVKLLDENDEVLAETVLAPNTTSWSPETQLALGGTYRFEIVSSNNAGIATVPAILNFTVEDVPAQPTDLIATVDDALYATLAWTADADADATPATGYEVAIIDENGECQVVATLKADATEWTTAAPLAHAATYAYAVRAVNEYGVSTWIAVEFATLEAASTVVTTAKDVVDAYDGEISLREAIQYAEAGATITFADDVETITLAGSQLEITKTLTIDGGENGVTVDADGKSRVFYLDAANGTVALTNLTITDGSTSYVDLGGAGVYVNGAATFTNVTIAENNAQYGEGAGVYVNGAATFTNVTIAGNNAIYGNFGGGGVYVNNGGSATFTDSKISENSNDFRGGAVYLGKAATVAFTDSEISGNTAEGDGGGLYVSSGATVAFTDSKISENIATYRDGGGVCVCSDATAIFTNVEISDNAATYNGSAVNVANGGAATFANVTITGNTSKYGAALDVSGTATLTNVTIAGNTAQYQVANFKGTATFTNVTIAGNTGAQTLYNDGTVNFYNSILVGNSSNALTNAGTANAYNTLSNFTKWTNADEEGVANYVYDETQPLFADGSYTLAAGSQAINKGNDAYLADEITTDLAGNPRFNGAVDLGAYESQIPNAPVLTVPELTVETFVPGEQTVALTWTDVDFETGYVVETLVDGAWVAASELLDAGTTTWTTDKLELGATYSFRVVAKNNAGDGVSAEVTFKTPNVPAKPELSATVNASTQPTVTLNWTNKGETGYRVEIQAEDETGNVVWTPLAKLDADVDNYTTDVQMGKTYFYRVVALNEYGENASDHAWVIVGDVPTQPELEYVFRPSSFPQATLTWAAESEAAYVVEQLVDDAWVTVATLEKGVGEWTTDALVIGQTYSYRVGAANAYGFGETSEAVEFALEAASTVVTSTSDVFDLTDGETTLREAIAYAKSGQTVSFAEDLRGKTITLSGAELLIDKTLTIQGFVDAEGAPQITIDADGASRVFNVNAGSAKNPVNFAGLTITGGNATNGGGVYIAWGKAANFTNVELTGNEATNGGGVYVRPKAVANFANVEMTGNIATNYGGGAYAEANSVAHFENSTLSGNQADFGAAARVDGNATFKNNVISENNATNYAGAVFVGKSSVANFEGNQISDNVAARYSGAIHVSGTANFEGNQITGNTATARDGGAVYVDGAATFVNDEIAGNAATRNGGALYVAGTATLTNATIADNQAGNGAGAYVANGGTANFKNSTIEDAVVGNVVISDSSDETPISAAFADAFDELDFFVEEDDLDALAKRLI